MWLVGAAGQRQEVLAVRAELAYGEVVTADDITIARVSVDPGIAVLPGADRDAVVGQVATTRLTPGMLLTEGMVEPVGEPGPGRVLVPIAVPAERMPAGGLRAGDRILAVDSEPAGSDAGASVACRADRCDRRAGRSRRHQRGHGRRCDDGCRGGAEVGCGCRQRPCGPHRRADRALTMATISLLSAKGSPGVTTDDGGPHDGVVHRPPRTPCPGRGRGPDRWGHRCRGPARGGPDERRRSSPWRLPAGLTRTTPSTRPACSCAPTALRGCFPVFPMRRGPPRFRSPGTSWPISARTCTTPERMSSWMPDGWIAPGWAPRGWRTAT